MADLVQRELRAKDLIASMLNGFCVLLMMVDEDVDARVADQLEEARKQSEGTQAG